MIRYEIRMKKPGAILHGQGLIQSVIAPNGLHSKGTIVVYVKIQDASAFELLLDSDSWVEEYFCHPLNPLKVA